MTDLDMKAGLAQTGWPILAIINDDIQGDWLIQQDPDTTDSDAPVYRLTKVGMDPVRARYTLIKSGQGLVENSTSLALKTDKPSLFDLVQQTLNLD